MKKLTIVFAVCMAVIFFTHALGQAPQAFDAKVYFVDRYMHCLIPINYKVTDKSPQKQAEAVLSALLKEQDAKSDFISYFAGYDTEISLSVKGETAHLDISQKLAEAAGEDRESQKLFVYQLVNSLCSLPKIKYARLSVDGKNISEFFTIFKGHEIFSPDYSI